MKIRLILALLAAATIFLGGCASTTKTPEEQMAAFQKTYNEVQTAVERADSVGGAWRDTDKVMASAKAAAEAGDFDKANDLLTQAMSEAQNAYNQAMAERGAGPRY